MDRVKGFWWVLLICAFMLGVIAVVTSVLVYLFGTLTPAFVPWREVHWYTFAGLVAVWLFVVPRIAAYFDAIPDWLQDAPTPAPDKADDGWIDADEEERLPGTLEERLTTRLHRHDVVVMERLELLNQTVEHYGRLTEASALAAEVYLEEEASEERREKVKARLEGYRKARAELIGRDRRQYLMESIYLNTRLRTDIARNADWEGGPKLYSDCPECRGRGSSIKGSGKCESCQGWGLKELAEDESTIVHYKECTNCHGLGLDFDEDDNVCTHCEGYGRILPDLYKHETPVFKKPGTY